MTDKELLERLRDVCSQLEVLVRAAAENKKYYTRDRIENALWDLNRAETSLAWHVENT